MRLLSMTHHTIDAGWIGCTWSRRLRKAYGALAVIEAEMDAVRHSQPFPEHAPTQCRLIGARLRALGREHDRLLVRIGKLTGTDEDTGRMHIARVRWARLRGTKA